MDDLKFKQLIHMLINDFKSFLYKISMKIYNM